MELLEKSQKTLELPEVLALLAKEVVSEPAKELALALKPFARRTEVERALRETSAAREMMVIRGSPSFSGIRDVRAHLARADIGGMLNTRELLEIAGVLRSARLVKAYANADSAGPSEIDYLFRSLTANRYLEEKITTAIAGEDEITDAASPELADIRRLMRAAASRAREALQKIISSPGYSKALQEAIITTRDGRFVVPVKVEHKGAVPGLVHDVSASGATLFVEPMAAVKANNELRELLAKERVEIERILTILSGECAAHREDVETDFSVLLALDLIFAKGKLSYTLDCAAPILSEKELKLRRARHPLLPRQTAVPIDLVLGDGFDTLIITGPNTGGKTVALKTLGLLCLMTKCGLHVPAADGCRIPLYDRVLADIGDEQSIAQSLSTFSSHMTNIVRILEACGENSLLLFDELGAGTDPVEGAALAIAIIEHARNARAAIAATTHYAELKAYATTSPGVQNASCEFDVETLHPTYKLLIGIPGKSNAFAISKRLGLPQEIIGDAKSRVSQESASFEQIIEKLEQQRQLMDKDSKEIAAKLREAEENAQKSERLRRELTVRLEKADEKARRESERILRDARAEAESILSQLRALQSSFAETREAGGLNEAMSDIRRRLNQAEEKLAPPEPEPEKKQSARPVRPGDVVSLSQMGGVKATVISVSPDRSLVLQAGIMRVTAAEDEVYLLEGEQNAVQVFVESSAAALRNLPASSDIDLRGMTSEEAVAAVESFIDSAIMGKLNTVTIIHGKGTGALRQAIHQFLKRSGRVKSFRLGKYGEGEAGVTVVELK